MDMKVIGIVTDTSYNSDTDRINIAVAVAVRPLIPDTFMGFRFESAVQVTGAENAQQLNNAVSSKIQADVKQLLQLETEPPLTDISTTKFS